VWDIYEGSVAVFLGFVKGEFYGREGERKWLYLRKRRKARQASSSNNSPPILLLHHFE